MALCEQPRRPRQRRPRRPRRRRRDSHTWKRRLPKAGCFGETREGIAGGGRTVTRRQERTGQTRGGNNEKDDRAFGPANRTARFA